MNKEETLKLKGIPVDARSNEMEGRADDTEEKKRALGRPLKDIDEGRFVPVSIAFPPKVLDQVIDMADGEEISRSQLVVSAVKAYLGGVTQERFEELQTREEALTNNVPIIEALLQNKIDDQYAWEYLGKKFPDHLPIHPAVLVKVKKTLSSRGGLFSDYSNDYQGFLSSAAKTLQMKPGDLSKMIDDSIEQDTVLEVTNSPR